MGDNVYTASLAWALGISEGHPLTELRELSGEVKCSRGGQSQPQESFPGFVLNMFLRMVLFTQLSVAP